MRKSWFLNVLLFLVSVNALGQNKKYQFSRIDMSSGLSHHTVNDILRDSSGFVWFATSSGLNRYDGYDLKIFRNIPGDTTSLHVDDLNRIYEGPGGKLWLFTHSGNAVYDPRTEKFHRNVNSILKELSIAPGVITGIKKDSGGRFWFIHYNQGLFLYDPQKKSTTRLAPSNIDNATISSLKMSALAEDSSGDIWIVHQNGIFEKLDKNSLKVTYRNTFLKDRFKSQLLEYHIMVDHDDDVWIYSDRNYGCFYFDRKKNSLRNFHQNSTDVKLNSSIVNEMTQDDRGMIWIGTENGGVNLLDKRDFSVTYLLNDLNDPKSLGENTIHSMYKDSEGIVWLGSYKNGVSYYHPDIFRFQSYKYTAGRGSVAANDINAFAEDQKGNLWIGTNGGGLLYYDRILNTYKQYVHSPVRSNSLSNNVIVSLLMDHQQKLWIGTYYGGLNIFDGKNFKRYVHDSANPKSLGDDNIWEIYEDSHKNIWIGTLKGGIDVYQRSKDEFIHYKSGEINSIHTPYVPAIIEDTEGNMWIGTGYGLELLQKSSGRFFHYLHDPSDSLTISNNSVLTILQDSRQLIWIGTQGGLNLFDPSTRTFRAFQEQDGLAHNSILTLVEDNQNNLWMSTPKGLSKLIVTRSSTGDHNFEFKNYGETDGLLGGAFHENAVLKMRSGELVFGGSDGFNIFDPSSVKSDSTNPSVIFTDFEIFNQSVRIGEEINNNIILPSSITETNSITLKPDNNFFTIEFAALNFFHPEKSQYKYKLEGFNNDWLITSGSNRRVTFTNLDPGDYVFRVKATNSDGIWSKRESILRIKVLPPFWKTNTAYGLYSLFIIGALLVGRRLVVARERVKFRIQQERQAAQRMHELDMMKIRFFTNVSHEFRTPLSLILTPLEKLLKHASTPDDKKHFELIHRNARRLLNLVNQLLDFRRMEIQEVNIHPSEGDIVQFVKDLVYSFSDLSEKKNISLTFASSIDSLETLFDQDKVEKIIFNLLSNAFKFTPENGKVAVSLAQVDTDSSRFIQIQVKDTGIGIPADKHEKIFERFFQNDLPETMVNQGSGIGLSITHEFVKIHGGTIEVESEVGKGSTFTVMLPAPDIHESVNGKPIDSSNYVHAEIEEDVQLLNDKAKPSLLLVEDNDDFRFYLKDNLKSDYAIVESVNGIMGWEKAFSALPDIIVTDVMMPGLNGVELCKKIKSDPRTSHIPVILLTARSSEEQKIEGFESGANDYITKPFSFEILQSRIKNLLHLRELGHKQFQKQVNIKVSDIEVTSMDEKLIANAVKLVEDSMGNNDFSVEELSRMIGMSRVQLYKKLYSLTGKTPIEFIRFIRIQRAAQLLEKSQLTVSEIAYQVGFNNPKYFAKYFKDQYDVLPSVYAAEKREKSKE